MEVKDNVKQRRVERVRKLLETTSESHPDIQLTQERIHYDANWTRRMEDPEFVWRQRFKQEQALNGKYQPGEVRSWLTPPSIRSIWTKMLISTLLFAFIWGLFHIQQPWADKGQQWVVASLTQSINVQALSAWYEDRFGGSPSFIPSFRDRIGNPAIKVSSEKRTYFTPVRGQIKEPYDPAHTGLTLLTQMDAPVYALDTGQVTFAGIKEDTGFTVIIRHPGGVQSVYGWLSEARVELNDWIKGGEPIGKVSKEKDTSGTLYFAVSKDGRYINPTDVITFD
jgi:stage IV sporulation protein FA